MEFFHRQNAERDEEYQHRNLCDCESWFGLCRREGLEK